LQFAIFYDTERVMLHTPCTYIWNVYT